MAPWSPGGKGGLLPSQGSCLQSSQRTWRDRAWTNTEHPQAQKRQISKHPLPLAVAFLPLIDSAAKCKLPLERVEGGLGPLDLHSNESFL